jgi:hypothetical protein
MQNLLLSSEWNIFAALSDSFIVHPQKHTID